MPAESASRRADPERAEAGMLKDLEKELRKWREDRAATPPRDTASDRRTVKVNGQEVVVVKKKLKPRGA